MNNLNLSNLRWHLIPNVGTLVAVAIMLFSYTVWAAPANSINNSIASNPISYQGTLTDAAGNPITANVGMIFRFYTVSSGGEALWSESHTGANSVPIVNGLFSVKLGSITQIPVAIWENPSVYLGIQVDGDNELSPRELISSVPTSIKSANSPQILGNILCDKCGDVTETVNVTGWVTAKGDNAATLIQTTVTTTGRPLLITFNARYSSQNLAEKWCGVAVVLDGQTIRFFHGDGNAVASRDFGCSSSYLITNLPAGTYTFKAMGWANTLGGDIKWTYQRQISVIEY
jgi:hypothetical protein